MKEYYNFYLLIEINQIQIKKKKKELNLGIYMTGLESQIQNILFNLRQST